MKFVQPLSPNEKKKLNRIIRSSDQYRARQRAHAIILSERKYSVDLISNIFDVHRDTVSRWIDVWYERGLDGLYDAPKPGRPRMDKSSDDKIRKN
jgi:transposase